jgi:peptidoglycan/LPS O-acetylase OafA/YrhL
VKRIPELDGLRGIAILLVIGCHYEVFARLFWGLPQYGWVGVDLFFVLSGFLITSVLLHLRGQVTPFREFYTRRIRRIIPPYIAFLVLLYLVTAAFGDLTLYKTGTIVKNLLFMQSVGDPLYTLRIMTSGGTLSLAHAHHLGPALTVPRGPVSIGWGVLWSLSIEEYYYLLWAPVVLWMASRRVASTGGIICLVALAIRWLGFAGSGAYFSIYHRFDAPVFGSLVALLVASKLSRRTVTAILLVAGLAGAATLAVVLVPMGNFIGREIRQDQVFMVFGLPSLSLIAASAVGISVTESGSRFLFLLRSGALRFMGRVSYTLYLLHQFVYLCIIRFFAPTWAVSFAALFCAVMLSWVSWKYFEQPILDGGRKTAAKLQLDSSPQVAA